MRSLTLARFQFLTVWVQLCDKMIGFRIARVERSNGVVSSSSWKKSVLLKPLHHGCDGLKNMLNWHPAWPSR